MAYTAKSATDPGGEGLQYHVRLKKGDVPEAVLLPGDPKRVEKIAGTWDKSEKVADYRQYMTYKGVVGKTELACTSTGIGAPGVAIAVEELVKVGVKTLIRVGSCGGLQPDMKLGDLVISTGAVRLEGTSKEYVRVEYPAVADYRVVNALVEAAEKLKVRYHVGITATTDTFTVGQGRPLHNGYLPSHQLHILDDMQKANVKNFEMEASLLFTLGNLLGVKTGAVCVVVADRVRDKFMISDEMEQLVGKVGSEAIKIIDS